jgi:hypothetical protein
MDVETAARNAADFDDPNSVEQCTGALLHASKCTKMYSDKWREAARQALAKLVSLKNILGMDFVKHHNI